MKDVNKASKTGFCGDIKQTNIGNKRHNRFYNPKVHVLEHFTC